VGHSRAEIAARHLIAVTDGSTSYILATYGDREVVPLHRIGTNRTGIAARFGPPYPASDRAVPRGGTYEDIHDTFDARWYVTCSHDGRPIKVERRGIVRDAEANRRLKKYEIPGHQGQ